MACMLCQKTDNELFDVFTKYGDSNRSVRDGLIELYGVDVEPHLRAPYCVCNMCMNIIINLSKLKRRLWSLIRHANRDRNARKLEKIWNFLASLEFEDDDDEEDELLSCRTPTPSSLLMIKHSRAYNHTLEEKIANKERNRSLSAASSGFGPSNLSESSEVVHLTSKRERRKGHNWTRRKRSAKSRATSELSLRRHNNIRADLSNWDRSYSPLSECSYTSYYSREVRETPQRKQGVKYDEQGRLIRKRTRSVSRAQELESKAYDTNTFYCKEKDCPLYFEDIDVLNHHKMIDHNTLALYFCNECNQRYTTLELFNEHAKIHDVLPFLCLLCQCDVENQAALQNHLFEHAIYSVSCKYCDKSFLNKKSCDYHSKVAHCGSRERLIYKRRLILDRIDKLDILDGNTTSNKNQKSDELKIVYMLYTDMERNTKDLDVTAENLKLMKIDFLVADSLHASEHHILNGNLSSNEDEDDDSELISNSCS